jgi:hypothetical protein
MARSSVARMSHKRVYARLRRAMATCGAPRISLALIRATNSPSSRGAPRGDDRAYELSHCYGLRPTSTTMTAGRCSICGPAEAETPAMMPSDISAAASNCAIGANERHAGGRIAHGKAYRRHAHPACGGQRLVERLPQRPRIVGAGRDLPRKFLPGESLQLCRDAPLRVRRQHARRLYFCQLELRLVRALARFRQQRGLAEAGKGEARQQHRNEQQRQCFPQGPLAIRKQQDGDDADHSQRHQHVAAVAPKLRAGHSEEEVAHAGIFGLREVTSGALWPLVPSPRRGEGYSLL